MANSPSALKRARQNETRRVRLAGQRARMRTAVKNVRKLVADKNAEGAQTAFHKAASQLDRMARKNAVAKGYAARNKSRLSALLKKLADSSS